MGMKMGGMKSLSIKEQREMSKMILEMAERKRGEIQTTLETAQRERKALLAKVSELDGRLEALQREIEVAEKTARLAQESLGTLSNPAYDVASQVAAERAAREDAEAGAAGSASASVAAAPPRAEPEPAAPETSVIGPNGVERKVAFEELSLLGPSPSETGETPAETGFPDAQLAEPAPPPRPRAMIPLKNLTRLVDEKGRFVQFTHNGATHNLYVQPVDDILRVTATMWKQPIEVQQELSPPYTTSLVSIHITWMIHTGKLQRRGGKAGPNVFIKATAGFPPAAPALPAQKKLEEAARAEAAVSVAERRGDASDPEPKQAILMFKVLADGKRLGHLPGGKAVLVGWDERSMVGDGECWLVNLEHRSTCAVAHPVEKMSTRPPTLVVAESKRTQRPQA